MKNRTPFLLVAALGAFTAAPAALAQDVPPPPPPEVVPAVVDPVQSDRAMFNSLVRQMRRVDRDTETAMDQAMAEARTSGGQASLETKARLLSLRDERDRVHSRLLILSMRHGWDIPELDPAAAAASNRKEAEDSVFGSVDTLVKRRFATEARRIAITARLPVVSMPARKK